MIWFLYAFLTAFFESIKDVISKKSLQQIDEYLIAWSLWFFALPLLIPILLFTGIPGIQPDFWVALPIGGSFNILASVLYMKAIKHSDLSLTVPMVAFSPLFLLITSPLIVGEFPDLYGFFGVICIVIGSYLLQVQKRSEGILQPFKSLLQQKGPRYMLLVAFIWSISANVDKVGVINSSPTLWIASMSVVVSICLFPFAYKQIIGRNVDTMKTIQTVFPIGLVYSLVILNQMIAINLTLVSYVISIKRMSAVFAVFWGVFILKEKGLKERLLGVLIMVIGVIFITIL
jgi:uncharacterized membrane protein